MADPALEEVRDVPGFKVLVEGAELAPEIALDVLRVTVCHSVDGADMFSIEINNWDSEEQELKWFDNELLREGSEVELRMGYVDDLSSLLSGEITAVEADFDEDGPPLLRLHGYDLLHRLRRGRKTRTFVDMTDSQIAEQVARDLHLRAEVEDTRIAHEYLLQDNQTDIDFLLERARRIHYEVLVREKTLHFRATANDRSEVVTLAYGYTLKSFFPRLSTTGQVSEVLVQGWDPKAKEAIVATAAKGDESTRMKASELGAAISEAAFFRASATIVDRPVFSTGEASQIAKGKFNEMALSFVYGEGTAIGEPRLRAGEVVELTGLGPRFTGLYYVTSSTHEVGPAGYTTAFTAQRNAA